MKNYLHLIAIACIMQFMNVNAQTVQWAKKGISPGFENGNAIITDDSSNVYVTGQFEFSSVFDNVTLNSYGQHDIFTAKYSADGNLKWIRKAGGKGGDIGNAIGVDAMHNVYIGGEVEDTVKFGSITLYGKGSNDIFIAKYDVNGNILWAKDFGTQPGSEKARALSVSPAGDVYVTGNFSDFTDFGNITLSADGGNDIFIAKFDTDGNTVWVKKAGGVYQDRGFGIVIDKDENAYVTGTFTQSASFSGLVVTNNGNNSSFLAKYNSSGDIQWVTAAGNCCDTTKSSSVALDEKGNIFLAGYFMDATTFGTSTFHCHGLSDIFVVKYDPMGNVLWAKQSGGSSEDYGYGIAVDTLNHLAYVTGMVREHGFFGSQYFVSSGYKDVFITAYDMNGDAQWVQTSGGPLRDMGLAIAVDSKGYIYNTGMFNDNATFGTTLLAGYPNAPFADFYVDKIAPAQANLPLLASTDLVITSANCSDLNLTMTAGGGARRMIIAHEGSAVTSVPVNGNIYQANANFRSGTMINNNDFVVYNGDGNNVTVTGLTPGTDYYFSVYEYNGYGMTNNYLTTPLTGNAVTATYSIALSGLQNAVCAGSSIDLTANGASSYTWSPATGLSTVSGSAVTITPQTTTTYRVTGINANNCSAETNFTVNVNQKPVVSFAMLPVVCSGAPAIQLTQGSPAGGVYSGTGVSNNTFNPSVSGTGIYLLQYRYTDANGCVNDAQSLAEVKALPSVSLSPAAPVCANAATVTLFGSPSGGVYSGTGVSGSTFNPSVGAGNYLTTYMYTDNSGCSASASRTMVVKAIPSVNLGSDIQACSSTSVTLNAGTGYNSYSWSTGATTPSIILSGPVMGLGSRNISVRVSNTNACYNSDTVRVMFTICTSINETADELFDVNVYPNPFTGSFTISTKENADIKIFDISGRLLEEQNHVSGIITGGENLASGTYFAQVTIGKTTRIIKIMKGK